MRRAALVLALALAGCEFEVFGTPVRVGADEPRAAASLAPDDLPAFFDCLRESGGAIVAAHRGGPGPGYAENAIPTFAHTVAATPALLEIDIARTRDNILVLMHDDTVDRTTNGAGRVRDLTLAQFRALRLEDEAGRVLDAHPPTLRQALDWAAGRAILELDVKRGVSFEDVVDEVRSASALGRVIFITYSDDAAVRVHALAPEMMLSVTIDQPGDLDRLGARGVDLTRVLAWTGTQEPDNGLWAALAARNVEAIFGTIGRWDESFVREGWEQYAEFDRLGVTIIATGRPIEASRDLDANDGVDGVGALRCASRR